METIKNNPETKPETNWVFVPVHKSRIIKTLAKAIILKLDSVSSTILPLIFKRKKETENFIFFSLPEDFKMNIRTSSYVDGQGFVNMDSLYSLDGVEDAIKTLSTKLPDAHTEEEDEQVAVAVAVAEEVRQ